MSKNTLKLSSFFIKITLLTIALFFIHQSIITAFFKDLVLQISLVKIYGFLFITVVAFVYLLSEQGLKNEEKILQTFLILSIIKMVLVLVFLLPIFLNKTVHLKVTIIHFFIPYFLFLIFEIFYSLKLLGLKK